MAAIFIILDEDEALENRRSKRRLREEAPFAIRIPDEEFARTYRVNKTLFEELCSDIIPLLRPKLRSQGTHPVTRIAVTLRFYTHGRDQGAVGNNTFNLSQQTVSRCINEVTNALNNAKILEKYMRFPQNKLERTKIQKRFLEKYNMPGVCGCIDCTHVAIAKPNKDIQEKYLNKNNYHSLNVQIICDADNMILNVNASNGGATADSAIWDSHPIKAYLEYIVSTREMAFLLGDSGYPLRQYLLTPIYGALENSPEDHYNSVHKQSHSPIVRTIEMLKARWGCLSATQDLYYSPDTAGKIIIACCVLHNLCVQEGYMEVPELSEDEKLKEAQRQDNEAEIPEPASYIYHEGITMRDTIVSFISSCK